MGFKFKFKKKEPVKVKIRKWKAPPQLEKCKFIKVETLKDNAKQKKGKITNWKYHAEFEKVLFEEEAKGELKILSFDDKDGKPIKVNLEELKAYDYKIQIKDSKTKGDDNKARENEEKKEKGKQTKTKQPNPQIIMQEKKEDKENDQYIKYLLAQEKPEFKSLGAGLHEIEGELFMFFGTKVYGGFHGMDAIVTSNRKIFVDFYNRKTGEGKNQILDMGIKYRCPFNDSVLDYTWSNNETPYSIMSFLYKEPKEISLSDCYKEIFLNNLAYMDYPEEIIHTSIACSILSSFFLPCFEAKGRDFFNAEKGSGKTKQAILYDLQMFNPIMSADMSGASYYRIIEGTSASIIIDDFDAIEKEKLPSQIQIMRAGYKKGQKTVRTENRGGFVPSSFGIFNSMVINNVGGLDEITQDRCNTYYLIKTIDKAKADKKFDERNLKWKIQRDKCYYTALLHWQKVKETYENLKIEGISGRDLERVAPILTIGKLALSEKRFNELLEYELSRINERKIKDVSEDWLFKAIKEVVDRIIKQNGTTLDIRLDELVTATNPPDEKPIYSLGQIVSTQKIINKEYLKEKHTISIFLGKIFRNTPLFKSKIVHGGFVKYIFEPSKVLKFLEIRGYKGFFSDEELKMLSVQSNQDNQPSQPNQPNQPIQEEDLSIKEKKDNQKNDISGEVGEDGEMVNIEHIDVFSCQDMHNALKILENQIGKLLPLEEIFKVLPSIPEDLIRNLLYELKSKALIFEPKENYFQLT